MPPTRPESASRTSLILGGALFGAVAAAVAVVFVCRDALTAWHNEWYPFGQGSLSAWPTNAYLVMHGVLLGVAAFAAATIAGVWRRSPWRWLGVGAVIATGVAWGLLTLGATIYWVELRDRQPLFGVARTGPPRAEGFYAEAVILQGALVALGLWWMSGSWRLMLAVIIVSGAAAASFVWRPLQFDGSIHPQAWISLWQLGVGASLAVWAGSRRAWVMRAADGTRCAACGYSLVGLAGSVCPECGASTARPGSVA